VGRALLIGQEPSDPSFFQLIFQMISIEKTSPFLLIFSVPCGAFQLKGRS
jgi:hypothetical protein